MAALPQHRSLYFYCIQGMYVVHGCCFFSDEALQNPISSDLDRQYNQLQSHPIPLTLPSIIRNRVVVPLYLCHTVSNPRESIEWDYDEFYCSTINPQGHPSPMGISRADWEVGHFLRVGFLSSGHIDTTMKTICRLVPGECPTIVNHFYSCRMCDGRQ